MFNNLMSMHQLMFVALSAFFMFFMFRHLFVKTKLAIFIYHTILFCILFIASVGGGGVQNDGYTRLEKFIELKKNHQLDDVKKNPQNYNSMLAIDLEEFKNFEEFKAYLRRNDKIVDKAEAITIGWLLVLMFDLTMICVFIFRYLGCKAKYKLLSMWQALKKIRVGP